MKQKEIEEINKQILNNIVENVPRDLFIDFYINHTRKETLKEYGIRTEKQLIKILKLFNYDFSTQKPSKLKGKPAKRTHESYILGGKKSADTQKENWQLKSEEEKQAWSAKQQKAHSTESFKQVISQINIEYNKNLSEEEKKKKNLQRKIQCEKTWSNQKCEILKQAYETRKNNQTFNSSSPEDNYYLFLIDKYGVDDVLRQYKDERYPFMCDFYIKSLDLFIELNISWTHGGHLFDENNEQDLYKLSIWKEKAKKSKYYENAIRTWTIRDVEKHQYAIKNKLNYVVYYFEDELYEQN